MAAAFLLQGLECTRLPVAAVTLDCAGDQGHDRQQAHAGQRAQVEIHPVRPRPQLLRGGVEPDPAVGAAVETTIDTAIKTAIEAASLATFTAA